MTTKKLLSPAQAAELLGLSPVTVRGLARKGDLRSYPTPGGHRRFLYDDLFDFARRRHLTLFDGRDERLRVLVVEDDRPFAAFVREALLTLEPQPEVDVAHDGFAAGRRVQQFRPHLTLLDLMLPGIDGFRICEGLKADPETRSMRIIAMTGYDSPENLTRILAAGAESCLSKPFTARLLLDAVTRRSTAEKHSVAFEG